MADLLPQCALHVCSPRAVQVLLGPGPLWSPPRVCPGPPSIHNLHFDIASHLAFQAMLGQLYADDVQAYQHCLASEALVTLNAMSRTMEALGSWMSSNRLRLNPVKTQFIWLGTRRQLAKLDLVALTSACPHFTFSSTVRDLGVTLNQELTLAPHINSLCRVCYYQLCQLRTVSRSLTSTAAATLVHSFVTSRLDYCSSLYIGLPATCLNCLDRVLRSAA